MGRLKEYPPGFRAPGSDLIVVRTVGLRQFGKHDRGQAVETVCLRLREDKGGEPCGNVRIILAKRVAGAWATKACEECAIKAKDKGRQSANLPDTPKETLRADLAAVNFKTYKEIRDQLEREGGARWAEFVEYRDRRIKLKDSEDETFARFGRTAWTTATEIEALQVVLCSPTSGLCCYRHETAAETPDNPRKEPTMIPRLIPFKVRLEDGTEQILNLANVQRFSIIPEPDDAAHPRLADDPPPGILASLMFSPEFTVTLRKADSERLLGFLIAHEAAIIAASPLYRGLLSPPEVAQEGGVNV